MGRPRESGDLGPDVSKMPEQIEDPHSASNLIVGFLYDLQSASSVCSRKSPLQWFKIVAVCCGILLTTHHNYNNVSFRRIP